RPKASAPACSACTPSNPLTPRRLPRPHATPPPSSPSRSTASPAGWARRSPKCWQPYPNLALGWHATATPTGCSSTSDRKRICGRSWAIFPRLSKRRSSRVLLRNDRYPPAAFEHRIFDLFHPLQSMIAPCRDEHIVIAHAFLVHPIAQRFAIHH